MASRRRTSPKAEPLDLDHELDEMYSSAITRPNLGFLRVTEPPTPSITRPAGNSGVLDASSMDTPSVDGVIFPTRSDDVKAIDGPAIDATSEDPPSMDVRPIGKWKIHHCLTVQDGHSANEQLLYEMLWRRAFPQTRARHGGRDRCRVRLFPDPHQLRAGDAASGPAAPAAVDGMLSRPNDD